jgi:hypothetical protein
VLEGPMMRPGRRCRRPPNWAGSVRTGLIHVLARFDRRKN